MIDEDSLNPEPASAANSADPGDPQIGDRLIAGTDAELSELAPEQEIHNPPDLTMISPAPTVADNPPRPKAIPTPSAQPQSPLLPDLDGSEDDDGSDGIARVFAVAAFLIAVTALAVVFLGLGPQKEIPANSITESQLAPGSVGPDQIDPSLSESLQGEPGPQGAPGPRGPRGETGPRGASGAAPEITLESSEVKGITADFATATVQCPTGARAVGGGGTVIDAEGAVTPATLSVTEPLSGRKGWKVEARRPLDSSSDAAPWTLKAWAVCQTQDDSEGR